MTATELISIFREERNPLSFEVTYMSGAEAIQFRTERAAEAFARVLRRRNIPARIWHEGKLYDPFRNH